MVSPAETTGLSPVRGLAAVALLSHGEADDRCPIGQREQMFVALAKAGCEVEYVRYPGASHMFFANGSPEHRADWLARVFA